MLDFIRTWLSGNTYDNPTIKLLSIVDKPNFSKNLFLSGSYADSHNFRLGSNIKDYYNNLNDFSELIMKSSTLSIFQTVSRIPMIDFLMVNGSSKDIENDIRRLARAISVFENQYNLNTDTAYFKGRGSPMINIHKEVVYIAGVLVDILD